MLKVYMITTGDNSDGNYKTIIGVFGTREKAVQYIKDHDLHIQTDEDPWNDPGCFADAGIEEWPLDPTEYKS